MEADPRTAFTFTQAVTSSDVVSLLNTTSYDVGQASATGTTLDYVRTKLLVETAGARSNVSKVVFLSVDGASMEGTEFAVASAAALKAVGARIVVVAIDVFDTPSLQEFRAIASSPSDVYELNSLEQLNVQDLQSRFLAKFFCASSIGVSSSVPLPTATPTTSVQFASSSSIHVSSSSILSSSAVATATPSATPTPFCDGFLTTDTALVLDGSGSMQQTNFDRVKSFFSLLLSGLPIGYGARFV